MIARILAGAFTAMLLAGCEQGPFERRMANVCDENNRPMHAAVTNGGSPTLVLACNPETGTGTVAVYRQAADGSLEEVARQAFDERVTAVMPLASGLLVALGGSHERRIMHMPGSGDGYGEPELVHATPYTLDRMVVSDVDGDGVVDVVIPRLDTWFENTGSAEAPGPFNRNKLDRNSRSHGDVIDVGSDGREDGSYVFVGEGLVRLYGKDGQQDIMLGKAVEEIGAVLGGGDINDDGRTDLVVSARGMPDEKVVMLALSNEDGDWALSEPVTGLLNPAKVLVRDFNADGTADLLAAPKAQAGEAEYVLSFVPGLGGGDFGGVVSIKQPAFPYRVTGGAGIADVMFLHGTEGQVGLLSLQE